MATSTKSMTTRGWRWLALALGLPLVLLSAGSSMGLVSMPLLAQGDPALPAAAPVAQLYLSPAASIVSQLQTARLPVTIVADYTPDSDPEHLLGLPGLYTSKTTFTIQGTPPGSGSVEVFDTMVDRFNRSNSLPQNQPETDLSNNTILLRLSPVLPHDTTQMYQLALNAAVLP